MTQPSLGLIETVGLTTAVTAADAALKSANVKLVGYEFAKGGGMTTVKVCGDVGAVKAAVAAATAAASAIGRVAAVTVIARPARGIAGMVASKDTVGREAANSPAREKEQTAPPAVNEPGETAPSHEDAGINPVSEEPAEAPTAPEDPAAFSSEDPMRDVPEAPAIPKASPVKPGKKGKR